MIQGESTNHREMDESINDVFTEEILWARNLGINFVIDGRPYSYDNDYQFIYSILSDSRYMRDYIPDEQGKIIQIHLDKVSNY